MAEHNFKVNEDTDELPSWVETVTVNKAGSSNNEWQARGFGVKGRGATQRAAVDAWLQKVYDEKRAPLTYPKGGEITVESYRKVKEAMQMWADAEESKKEYTWSN